MYTFEIDSDSKGDFIWRYKAPNGSVMLTSPRSYARLENAIASINTLKASIVGALVRDLTSQPMLLRR